MTHKLHNARQALIRGVRDRLMRMRHLRGHGVHSPYIYRIVREAYMRRTLIQPDDHDLYDVLQGELNVKRRWCVELQNILSLCGFSSFEVDPKETAEVVDGVDVVVYSANRTVPTVDDVAEYRARGTTIVIAAPYATPERRLMCESIVAHHHSTSVDRVGYLLIFNNHLPKQHFTL